MNNRPVHDKLNHRFYIEVSGQFAELNYIIRDKSLFLMKTTVPKELAGRGLAKELVNMALSFANISHLKLAVLCSFSRKYLVQNPDLDFQLDKSFHPNGLD